MSGWRSCRPSRPAGLCATEIGDALERRPFADGQLQSTKLPLRLLLMLSPPRATFTVHLVDHQDARAVVGVSRGPERPRCDTRRRDGLIDRRRCRPNFMAALFADESRKPGVSSGLSLTPCHSTGRWPWRWNFGGSVSSSSKSHVGCAGHAAHARDLVLKRIKLRQRRRAGARCGNTRAMLRICRSDIPS